MPESQIREECLKKGSKGSSERLKPVSKEKVQGFEGGDQRKSKKAQRRHPEVARNFSNRLRRLLLIMK